MILVDTGPLVALFDPKDDQHGRCTAVLKAIREPLGSRFETPQTVGALVHLLHLLVTVRANRLGSPAPQPTVSVIATPRHARLPKPHGVPIPNRGDRLTKY